MQTTQHLHETIRNLMGEDLSSGHTLVSLAMEDPLHASLSHGNPAWTYQRGVE